MKFFAYVYPIIKLSVPESGVWEGRGQSVSSNTDRHGEETIEHIYIFRR